MAKPITPAPNGIELLASFQSALLSSATVDAAKAAAESSEATTLSYLDTVSQGSFLQPENIPGTTHESIARASVDAHIKKVQAKQIADLNDQQMTQAQKELLRSYVGRQARISPLNPRFQAIRSIWFDIRNGYREGVVSRGSVSGIIDDMRLDEGILILSPRGLNKLLNSSLRSYVVQVVDPGSLQPLVNIRIR